MPIHSIFAASTVAPGSTACTMSEDREDHAVRDRLGAWTSLRRAGEGDMRRRRSGAPLVALMLVSVAAMSLPAFG